MAGHGTTPHTLGAWQPVANTARMQLRAACYRQVRAFFETKGVLEVDTPLMSHAAPTDPMVEPIRVHPFGATGPAYLNTSPEVCMKRLLAAHNLPMYQLCKAFRADEQGVWHNPEFTLLEWYRPGWTWDQLSEEVLELLHTLCPHRTTQVRTMRYADVFRHQWGWDPLDAPDEQVLSTLRKHVSCDHHVPRETALQLLLSHVIEPAWPDHQCTVLSHFPVSQAALARVDPQDPRVALRFEVYWGSVELANGYDELTDPVTLTERMQSDMRARAAQQAPRVSPDWRLVEASERLSPCAGVALGVDRVLALLAGVSRLSEVLAFPFDRA